MATIAQWVSATRPQTLPASLAPVLLGIGLGSGIVFDPATTSGDTHLAVSNTGLTSFVLKAGLALLVALFLQIAVNFSNDYSDGIRGTDTVELRVGPKRLVGSGLASPQQVLGAALFSFFLAGICGLALVIYAQAWWWLLAGGLAVVAAWGYTGGKHPYAYMSGVSELMVFLFFGLMAVLGTVWVLCYEIRLSHFLLAAGIGLLSCALLMLNNLRDIPGDRIVGKNTLAVRLGEAKARLLILGYLLIATYAVVLRVFHAPNIWAVFYHLILVLVLVVFTIKFQLWLKQAKGKTLILGLKKMGLITLFYGLSLGVGAGIFGY